MGPGRILPITTSVLMVVLLPSLVRGMEGRIQPPAPHFLLQRKAECRFSNGSSGEVRYLDRYIYGRQEYVRFDSRRGLFEAVAELGEPTARYWNSRKEELEDARATVDRFCRHNYGVDEEEGTATMKVEPNVKISHTRGDPLAHQTLLICTATGYYPSEVNFKWLRNGQEQTEGVGYAEELQNGDWTFQNQAMLNTVPEEGDVYACQVEHSSLKEPVTVQWEPRLSQSSKNKMWAGGIVALLGMVFAAVAIFLYLRARNAAPAPPAEGLMN